MDEISGLGNPCGARQPSLERPHSPTRSTAMSSIAAICIIAFIAALALLNRIEFGRVD